MSEFDFSEGDTLLVRVREHGDSGNIIAKFEAECRKIQGGRGFGSPKARLDLPFGDMNTVSLRPYEAEFEMIE